MRVDYKEGRSCLARCSRIQGEQEHSEYQNRDPGVRAIPLSGEVYRRDRDPENWRCNQYYHPEIHYSSQVSAKRESKDDSDTQHTWNTRATKTANGPQRKTEKTQDGADKNPNPQRLGHNPVKIQTRSQHYLRKESLQNHGNRDCHQQNSEQ